MADKLVREWTQLIGDSSEDYGYLVSAAVDGSVYLTGFLNNDTYNSVGGQPYYGHSDTFLSKYSRNGFKEWTKFLGTSDTYYDHSIDTNSDGSIYIAGSTEENLDGQTNSGSKDAFVSKYTSDGSKEWTRLLGSSNWEHANSVSSDDDGSVYIAGYTHGRLDGEFSSGSSEALLTGTDAFLSKFNSDGTKEWTRLLGSYGSTDYENRYRYYRAYGTAVCTAPDGSVYIAGHANGHLDGQTNNRLNDYTTSNDVTFLSKYNSDGSKEWTKLLDKHGQYAHINTDADGFIYISNSNRISKYNGDGAEVWSKARESLYSGTSSISNTADGSIYMTGYTYPSTDVYYDEGDVFITKINSDGSEAWTEQFGSSSTDFGSSVTSATDGSVYITGNTRGNLDGQTNNGGLDAFLSKYNINKAPTGLNLSETSFNENLVPGTVVAIISSIDAVGDTFSYTLVSGVGSFDNEVFTIDGDQLKIAESPDFETKSSYSIRIQSKDFSGLTIEKEVTLSVNDVNEGPTDLSLSASTFHENIERNSVVAILSTLDPDFGDTHTYELISDQGYYNNGSISTTGSGYYGNDSYPTSESDFYDNSAFTIDGSQLRIVESPDFEEKSSYRVRLQSKDSGGLTREKEVTFNVTDVNEAPEGVSLSTFAFNEYGSSSGSGYSVDDGSVVASLSTSDPDSGDSHTYKLVSGVGDSDNDAFTIEDDHLKIIESADFEIKSSYSLRLQTKDAGGLKFDRAFTLNVNDLKEDSDIYVTPLTRWWTKLHEISSDGIANSITVADDGSVYIAGSTERDIGEIFTGNGDAFLSKYRSDGSKEWTQFLETSSFEWGSSVSTASDGSVYIAGWTYGNLDGQFNSGNSDAFLAKYNADGSKAWTKLIGTTSSERADSVSFAADGSIYIAGSTYGNLDGQNNSSGGSGDAFIAKYNSDGIKEWTKLLGLSSAVYPGYCVNTSSDGSVYIAGGDLNGQTNGGKIDAFLAKYNSDGSNAWTQSFGTSYHDFANSVAISDDGSIYVVGTTGEIFNNISGKDAFLTKFNGDGSKAWTQLLGSYHDDNGSSVSVDADGSVYIVGDARGDIDGQLNNGSSDAFVSKYSSDGSKEWTKLFGSNLRDNSRAASIAGDGSIYIAGDWGDGYYVKPDIFLSKHNINKSPIDLSLSESSFDENIDSGHTIGTLSTSDPDHEENHTYTLVSGDGDADNGAFTIEGDQLKIIESADFETKSSYSIRLQTKDFGGLTFEKSFDLDVNDLKLNIAVQSDLSGRQGSLVGIPIQINDASGVEAIDLNIAYDQNIFDIPTSSIFEPGELNPEWSFITNASVPGVLSLSSFGNSELGSEYGSIAVLNLKVKDYAEIGKSKIDIVDVEVNKNQITSTITDSEILVEKSSFQVRDVESHSHGLSLQLNDTPDMDVFRLYSGKNAGYQDPSLVLSSSSNEEVTLSAHWEDDSKVLHLLSNQILEDGDFTLKIRADGLVSQSGDFLDGNGDGEDGDNYEYSFTHVTPDHFISVGDTARSSGQDLSINGKDLKDGTTGVPIHLSTTSSLQSVSGEISYDSDLLKDVSLVKGSDLPGDWIVNYSESSPGTLAFTVSGQSVTTGSIQETLRLMGQVEANASDSYGSTSLIQATITDSSDGQMTFKSDPGLMVNAYSGDTTGNGSHSSLDASRVQRVVVGLDSGFDAFDDINPILIGDTTGNGSLSSLDASRIQQEVVGLPVDTFPGIPEI